MMWMMMIRWMMMWMKRMMRVFLFRAGTDLTTLDNNGRTPLQLAQVDNTICYSIVSLYLSR